jgi:hypothetical protein
VRDLARELHARRRAAEDARRRRFATGAEAPHGPFPASTWRVPVPHVLFRALPDLSGSAVRLACHMIRALYRRRPHADAWECSPAWCTRGDLEARAGGPCGLGRTAWHRAAKELQRAGFLDVREASERGAPALFRFTLAPPKGGFTYVAASFLRAAAHLSGSAAALGLAIYRATWGQTRREERRRGRVTVHRVRARMTNADLARAAGLSIPTVRRAVAELEAAGHVERERPDGASAWHYRPTPPPCEPRRAASGDDTGAASTDRAPRPRARQRERGRPRRPRRRPAERFISCTPTILKDAGINNPRPRAREADARGDSGAGCVGRYGTGTTARGSLATAEARAAALGLSAPQREAMRALIEAGAWPRYAVGVVQRRAVGLIRRTLDALEASPVPVRNPGGWLRRALESTWHASTPNAVKPARRRCEAAGMTSTGPPPPHSAAGIRRTGADPAESPSRAAGPGSAARGRHRSMSCTDHAAGMRRAASAASPEAASGENAGLGGWLARLASGDRTAWPTSPPAGSGGGHAGDGREAGDGRRAWVSHRDALAILDALGLAPTATRPLTAWWRVAGPRRYPRPALHRAALGILDDPRRPASAHAAARRVVSLASLASSSPRP